MAREICTITIRVMQDHGSMSAHTSSENPNEDEETRSWERSMRNAAGRAVEDWIDMNLRSEIDWLNNS